jgi:hypothetical protein
MGPGLAKAEVYVLLFPSSLPNLAPLWANRNLGANRSDVVSGGILKRHVNVAVYFHFCVNDAASESIPLFLLAFAFSGNAEDELVAVDLTFTDPSLKSRRGRRV